MRTRLFATVSVALVAILLATIGTVSLTGRGVGAQGAPTTVLTTTLTGAAEVPGPGDPDGTGQATLILLPEQGRLCYVLTAQGIAPATAAHVHAGRPGEAGPVAVTLEPPTWGASGGCVAADPALLRAIAEDPAGYYVNVHNDEYPAGAIRGQLG